MKEIVQLHRFGEKCMDVIAAVSELHNSAKKLVQSASQEDLDQLASLATNYQQTSEVMQSCLMTFLKELIEEDPDKSEIDANETELGYKL